MKAIIQTMTAIVMLASMAAHAQMAVTDPTSYTYYVEQLKKQAVQIETATQEVSTLGGVLTTANDINNNMMGHYNRAMALVRRMNKLQKILTRDTHGDTFQTLKQIGDAGNATGGVLRAASSEIKYAGQDKKDYQALAAKMTGDTFTDTKTVLDVNFGDTRDTTDPMAKYRKADGKHQAQQVALKDVVASAAATMDGIDDRMAIINDLANQVDETANQKDAQDLTNSLLVEVLKTLTDMLVIAAQSNQANALVNYTGVTDATFADRQKVLAGIGATIAKSEGDLILQGQNTMAANGKMPSKF